MEEVINEDVVDIGAEGGGFQNTSTPRSNTEIQGEKIGQNGERVVNGELRKKISEARERRESELNQSKEMIEQLLSQLRDKDGEIKSLKANSVPNTPVPFNWPSLMGGVPLGMIPTFNWDPSDRGEAERFITALLNLADEQQWTENRLRYTLESKLGPKARGKYFEGLGNNENLSISQRVKEFLALFSRKIKPDEGQDLFFTCIQNKDESVASFKLRLIGFSNVLRQQPGNNAAAYDGLLLSQFRRGLRHDIKLEVMKLGEKSFEETVSVAIRMEEVMQACSNRSNKINSVDTADSKINELTDEIKNLKALFATNTDLKNAPDPSRCKFCCWTSHNVDNCPNKSIPGFKNRYCNWCLRFGHTEPMCYRKKKQADGQSAQLN